MKEKKKVTKHVLGPITFRIMMFQNYSVKKKEKNPEIIGVFFSNEGSKGREPLFDASLNETKDIFAYWKDKDKGIIEISSPEPGYEIKAPKNMCQMFYGDLSSSSQISYLDVSHLDVSESTNFQRCFATFGGNDDSYIHGLETWDVSNGENFIEMFAMTLCKNKTVNLDLSSWKFGKEDINFLGMFQGFAKFANEVHLNLENWNVAKGWRFDEMFRKFAFNAQIFELKGVSDWIFGDEFTMYFMFDSFCRQSNMQLNLSKWNFRKKHTILHDGFAKNTFFRIKEPLWPEN